MQTFHPRFSQLLVSLPFLRFFCYYKNFFTFSNIQFGNFLELFHYIKTVVVFAFGSVHENVGILTFWLLTSVHHRTAQAPVPTASSMKVPGDAVALSLHNTQRKQHSNT